MRVKICGITRAADAALAVDLGAHALGFVFWPNSRRYIAPDAAAPIIARLPPFVSAVGVFVNQPAREVLQVSRLLGLHAVQLHGDERPEDYPAGTARIIKSLAVGPSFDVAAAGRLPASVTVLLDAADPDARGGTGRTIDWAIAATVAAARPAILAGGLRAENVAGAIRAVRPYAVDVSSGVEASPGVKDAARMRAFFRAALAAGDGRDEGDA